MTQSGGEVGGGRSLDEGGQVWGMEGEGKESLLRLRRGEEESVKVEKSGEESGRTSSLPC